MRTTSVARWVSEVKTPWAWRFGKRCLPKREFWKSGLPRAQNDTRRRRARSDNPKVMWFKSHLRNQTKEKQPIGLFLFCRVMRTTSVARWVSKVKTPWAWRFGKRCLPKREFWKSGLPRAQNDTRRRRARSDKPKVMWFKSLSPAGSVTVRL